MRCLKLYFLKLKVKISYELTIILSMKMIRTILAKIRRADEKYHLFSPKDKIVLGLSGGKDSMLLFYAMSLYSRFQRKQFEIVPVMLDLGFPHFAPKKILNYVRSLGYNLIIEDARNVYPILLENQKENKHLPCSICSRMKKACIDKVAHQVNANKVMFAHHADDAIETLFMNMIHGKRIATFAPKMHLSKDDITFIRPLIYVHENEIRRCIKEENIPVLDVLCPSDHKTERENIKMLLEKEIYAKYPLTRDGFLEMLEDYEHLDIYFDEEDLEIKGHLHMRPIYAIDDYLIYRALLKKDRVKEQIHGNLRRYLIYDKTKLIGVLSYKYEGHTVQIYDLHIRKEKHFLTILNYLIIFFKKKLVPLKVEIYSKENRKHLLTYGFRKERNYLYYEA